MYVVNFHFSRYPDGCWERCQNLAILTHLYHVLKLSNGLLYEPAPKGVKNTKSHLNLYDKTRSLTLICPIFDTPLGAAPQWKALRHGKDEASANLLHIWGFADSQSSSIVCLKDVMPFFHWS